MARLPTAMIGGLAKTTTSGASAHIMRALRSIDDWSARGVPIILTDEQVAERVNEHLPVGQTVSATSVRRALGWKKRRKRKTPS